MENHNILGCSLSSDREACR